jgi:dienelactone hydrolase
VPDGPWSPPAYVDRAAFREVETTVPGATCDLPARVSVPRGDGPFPGVVIVHGSGPQGMDGTIGAVRPYRDLAWGLASRGVAVLRYDKVSAVCPGDLGTVTVDSVVVDDAVRAVNRLREAAAVSGVAVVGHSLGGALTPRILRRVDDPAGGAALAANARPLYALLPEQVRAIQRADGDLTADENETYDRVQTGVDRVEAGEYDAAAAALADFGLPASLLRSLAEYDRFAAARATTVPLSFLQGTGDVQVSVARDFELWRERLANRPNTRFELYEGLNHLLTPAETAPGENAYRVASTVAGRVVADLAAAVDDAADGTGAQG